MDHLILADVREGLTQLDDCSVDAIVTDPPYELGFMGKAWDASDIANTLHCAKGISEQQAVAYRIHGENSSAMRAEGFDASEDGTGRGQPIVPVSQEVADTLTSSWHNSNGATAGNNPGVINPIIHGLRVRRLMPIEAERLQGFPDGYTDVPHRGKPAADGPRYKALGNSMAVPCMAFIGLRIKKYLNNELGRGFL